MGIGSYNVHEVEDGYIAIICIAEHHWDTLANLMNRPNLSDLDRFSSKAKRANHIEEIDSIVSEWLDGRTKDATVDLLLNALVKDIVGESEHVPENVSQRFSTRFTVDLAS